MVNGQEEPGPGPGPGVFQHEDRMRRGTIGCLPFLTIIAHDSPITGRYTNTTSEYQP